MDDFNFVYIKLKSQIWDQSNRLASGQIDSIPLKKSVGGVHLGSITQVLGAYGDIVARELIDYKFDHILGAGK